MCSYRHLSCVRGTSCSRSYLTTRSFFKIIRWRRGSCLISLSSHRRCSSANAIYQRIYRKGSCLIPDSKTSIVNSAGPSSKPWILIGLKLITTRWWLRNWSHLLIVSTSQGRSPSLKVGWMSCLGILTKVFNPNFDILFFFMTIANYSTSKSSTVHIALQARKPRK